MKLKTSSKKNDILKNEDNLIKLKNLRIEDILKNEANLKVKTKLFFTENKIVLNGLNHSGKIYFQKKKKIELH